MGNDRKESVIMVDRYMVSVALFSEMRDWLNSNRDHYSFFTPHDKMVMDAKGFNDLSFLDKRILMQEVDFRVNKLPFCEEGLNDFTIRKERKIAEIIDKLI